MQNNYITDELKKVEERLGNEGRVILRKSGTEPLIRIMAEASDQKIVDEILSHLASVIINVQS